MDNQSGAAVEDSGREFFRDVKPYAIVDRLDQLRGRRWHCAGLANRAVIR